MKIAISLTLLFLFYKNSNLSLIAEKIGEIALWQFVLLALLYAFFVLLQVLKWRVLLPEISIFLLLKANLYGKFYTVVLPGQMFGEAAKTIAFGKDINDYSRSASSVVVDKITGMIALFIVGIFGFTFTKAALPQVFLTAMILLMAIVLLILFSLRINIVYKPAAAAVDKLGDKCGKIMPKAKFFFGKVKDFLNIWQSYVKEPKTILCSVCYGITFNLVNAVIIAAICFYLDTPVRFIELCWVTAMLSTVLVLPISFGGVGVREATLVGLLAYLGVSATQALSLSIILFIFTVLMAAGGGLCVFFDMCGTKKVTEGENS